MNVTSKITRKRAVAGVAGLAVVAGLAATGAGMANAGTLPVTHPGEPTTAMTITNHSNHYEFLTGATPGAGHWVNAPQQVLAPGASETVVAVAPNAPAMTTFVNYRVGLTGPVATYELENMAGNVNYAMSGVGDHYFIDANISSGFPNVNATYNLS